MKLPMTVAGVIAIGAGLLFAAQGSGYFPYPSESFMINDTRWIYYGLAIAISGGVLVAIARR
jgi:hypothetical protein